MSSRIFPFGGAASSIKLSDDVRLNNTPFSLLSAFIYHIIHSVVWGSWIQMSSFRMIVMWMLLSACNIPKKLI